MKLTGSVFYSQHPISLVPYSVSGFFMFGGAKLESSVKLITFLIFF